MDDAPDRPSTLNPTALPLADAAKLLAKVSGYAVTEEMLQTDVLVGAPTNCDGTLNLVHFASWLIKEMALGDCPPPTATERHCRQHSRS